MYVIQAHINVYQTHGKAIIGMALQTIKTMSFNSLITLLVNLHIMKYSLTGSLSVL